jgi:hypothetical protein
MEAKNKQLSDESLSGLGSDKLLSNWGSDISMGFLVSARTGSTDLSSDGRGTLCTKYAKKISDVLERYDNCLQGNNYKLVQWQAKFASIYANFKHYLSNGWNEAITLPKQL